MIVAIVAPDDSRPQSLYCVWSLDSGVYVVEDNSNALCGIQEATFNVSWRVDPFQDGWFMGSHSVSAKSAFWHFW